jgi:hypothetical protein
MTQTESKFTVPERHQRTEQRKRHWVVTCADHHVYEDLLVPFLGSLISLAEWNGSIAVFDYGLSKAQVTRLKNLGVAVKAVKRRHTVTLDRFIHMREFATENSGIIGQWDSDVWFTGPLFELFETYHKFHQGRLLCNVDSTFQQSNFSVADNRDCMATVKWILEAVQRVLGQILQCGFVCGDSQIIASYCRYLEKVICDGQFRPTWNSDTVGLNYFYYHHPDLVDIVDNRYNCLIDCSPLPLKNHFFIDELEIRALHVTSAWRGTPEGKQYLFQTVYPALYEQWRAKLDV